MTFWRTFRRWKEGEGLGADGGQNAALAQRLAENEWARTETAKDKVVHVDVRKGLGYT